MIQTKFWDSIEGRYAERSYETATAMETFGELPVDPERLTQVGARIADVQRRFPPANDNARVALQPERPMSGFLSGLTAEQQTKALAYDGPEPVLGEQAFEVRSGDYMQTYTGRQFWPLDPRADEVEIEDIAHSLSMQCRYGGHSLRFYSVAEHCVLMARWVQAECGKYADAAFYALMHDAAEAYLADVPRPLKRHLVGYKEAERRVMAAVCVRFEMALEPFWPNVVHEADTRILADEIRQNMRPMAWHAKHDDPLGVRLEFWSPEQAKHEFLAAFDALSEMRRAA